jgi:trigger factor
MRRMGVEDHSKAPPRSQFTEVAERRVRLGLLLRQYIDDNKLRVEPDRVRQRVEEMCASYENPDDMVAAYMSNAQLLQQIEPMVLEEQAVELLVKNGVAKDKKISFKEFMKP